MKGLLEESFTVERLDNRTVEEYCNLYCKLREAGALVPDADLLIAATAISQNMTLKTDDEHFSRSVDLGLRLAPG